MMGPSRAVVPQALCRPMMPYESFHDWVLVAALASPHFLYAFIWFFPKTWQRAFGKGAVDAFAFSGVVGKLVQFQAVALWFWISQPNGLCLDLSAITLTQWLGFLLLGAVGQALNAGIYHAIGTAGVYYGFKLGKKIPWHSGFPFNVVSHPQYVGSALTVWAFAIVLAGQVKAASLAANPVVWVATYWTGLYIVTGIQEQYF
uniref:phosphatidyl-N-methylethanolamine N-methyltransferase n=1 Tax=Chlamydomonas applanata TaxID=35704 RepID=A0A2Z5X881_CHLAP|nr:phospholipid-N-methyltransferase [Chlamydomonas applanata]